MLLSFHYTVSKSNAAHLSAAAVSGIRLGACGIRYLLSRSSLAKKGGRKEMENATECPFTHTTL